MSNFISKAKDIYYSGNSNGKSYADIFDRINDLSKIKNYFHSDLFNIEELLSIYDMEYALAGKRENNAFAEFILDVIQHYSFKEENIERTFPGNWYDFIFGDKDHHRNILAFVANIFQLEFSENPATTRLQGFKSIVVPSDIKYSIVSMNYDALLETALTSFNRDFHSNHAFTKLDFNIDWSNPMLYKLHGDIENNTIIPPTWAKNIDKQMLTIWKNAFNLIKSSTQIRILGYSLPISDTYFQYFLKAAISNNPYLKCIDVVCKDANGSVKSRYKDHFSFRDFRFQTGDLADYCKPLWANVHPGHFARNAHILCNALESIHMAFMAQQ